MEEESAIGNMVHGSILDEKVTSLKMAVRSKIKNWRDTLNARYDNQSVVYAAILNEQGFQRCDITDAIYFSSYEEAYEYINLFELSGKQFMACYECYFPAFFFFVAKNARQKSWECLLGCEAQSAIAYHDRLGAVYDSIYCSRVIQERTIM